jgi:hypothetical protein
VYSLSEVFSLRFISSMRSFWLAAMRGFPFCLILILGEGLEFSP